MLPRDLQCGEIDQCAVLDGLLPRVGVNHFAEGMVVRVHVVLPLQATAWSKVDCLVALSERGRHTGDKSQGAGVPRKCPAGTNEGETEATEVETAKPYDLDRRYHRRTTERETVSTAVAGRSRGSGDQTGAQSPPRWPMCLGRLAVLATEWRAGLAARKAGGKSAGMEDVNGRRGFHRSRP